MWHRTKVCCFPLMLSAALSFCPEANAVDVAMEASRQKVVLGILEDVPGVYVGETNSYAVRVVFKKNSGDWQAFPSNCPNSNCLKTIVSSYPVESTWNIGFDGSMLGQVTAKSPNGFKFYNHIGLQNVTSDKIVPVIGSRSSDYAGYEGRPVYRPLVANSQPYFKDREFWKPLRLSGDYTGFVRHQFRKKFPKLCKIDDLNETQIVPFPYHDKDVKVTKAYGSKNGWILAQLRLEKAIDCDDTGAGFEIYDQWYAISPRKSIQFVGEGMWLVDTGDYDNSGRDALVFSIDRDNRGGYELFYDDFKKHVVFEFGYH